MSVFTAVYLDCNGEGCTARFVPLQISGDSAAVRAEAREAGWLVNFRGRGADCCPVCADRPAGDYRTPRGICGVCGTEQPVTGQAVLKLHTPAGRRSLCDGGGHPPERLVRAHGAPLDYDWRTQRGGPGRA